MTPLQINLLLAIVNTVMAALLILNGHAGWSIVNLIFAALCWFGVYVLATDNDFDPETDKEPR